MLLLRHSMTCCNSGCNCFRLTLTDEGLTESRDTAQHCACNKYKHPLTADCLTQLYLACPAIQIFIWLDSPSRRGINSLQVLHYNSPRGIAKFFFSFLFFVFFGPVPFISSVWVSQTAQRTSYRAPWRKQETLSQ